MNKNQKSRENKGRSRRHARVKASDAEEYLIQKTVSLVQDRRGFGKAGFGLMIVFLGAFVFFLRANYTASASDIQDTMEALDEGDNYRGGLGIYEDESEDESSVQAIETEEGNIINTNQKASENDNAYTEPEPDKLNLCFLYPDDYKIDDSKDVMDSYGGQIYTDLMSRNSSYYAEALSIGEKSPYSVAKARGIDQSLVTGKYGLIPSFSNVTIKFKNSDGTEIQDYSNVKDIMSMVSVYSFYHDYKDHDTFLKLCLELQKKSHSTTVSIGDIYYDKGCTQVPADTAETDAEAEKLYNYLHQEDNFYFSSGSATVDSIIKRMLGPASDEKDASSDSESDVDSTLETAFQSENTVIESAKAEEEESDTKAPGTSSKSFVTEELPGSRISETSSETDSSEEIKKTEGIPFSSPYDEMFGENASEGLKFPDGFKFAEAFTEYSEADIKTLTLDEIKDIIKKYGEEGELYCPGHVDLDITIKIAGFEEKNGLRTISLSSAGEWKSEDESGKSLWKGWEKEAIRYVEFLSTQDWYKKYGLSTINVLPGKPLTDEEIAGYLELLPRDTSEKRETLIRYALRSVGRIPYYWGGKCSYPGYDKNNFGQITEPDNMGRVKKGLDCSGWISWLYYSAVSDRLHGAQSTGLLLNEGTRTERERLKPGDIGVRPGTESHTALFLSYTSDGNMLVIDENATDGNVSVREIPGNFPYFRNLCD